MTDHHLLGIDYGTESCRVGIFTADGTAVYGTNTHIEEFKAKSVTGPFNFTFEIQDLRLVEGSYIVDIAAHRRE